MHPTIKREILNSTDSKEVLSVELVQSLWSGFGAIERIYLKGGNTSSVIVKRIQPPDAMNHPRGWNSDVSAARKMKSYQIEEVWYRNYASELPLAVKVPAMYFQKEWNGVNYIVMEDLHASGFAHRYTHVSEEKFNGCLHWLANLHAFYLNKPAEGLWEIGTYWHWATRQEEWHRMQPGKLKDQALELDNLLNTCRYQTILHGDAKPANFCFSAKDKAAAVDFQYVGKGCGIKDVVYLMSSALGEKELFANDKDILDRYFLFLEQGLNAYERTEINISKLREEWEAMYTIAWADFVRFLEGWSPGHARKNEYAILQCNRLSSQL